MEDTKLSLTEIIDQQKAELFSEVEEYLNNDKITDIEWDGVTLWITELGKGCYEVTDKLSDTFVTNLAIRLSNIMKIFFNVQHPILEAHTDNLRISIFHESRCGHKSITIRKVPASLRYTHEVIVETEMMPEPLLNLLENCIIAHKNTVIGGRPHAGKTELLKYLSGYIPANEKVITLEDNSEIHYRELHPGRKHTPFIVDDKCTYSDAIKGCLRHNADWLLLSESRGPEVVELVNALSTGSFCMTTMHVDEVADMPDRMFNMLGESSDNPRFINNIYKYFDIGLIVKADKKERRAVTELGFFDRKMVTKIDKNGIERKEVENIYIPFYTKADGMKGKEDLPEYMLDAFEDYGITDPFSRPPAPTDVCLFGDNKQDEK